MEKRPFLYVHSSWEASSEGSGVRCFTDFSWSVAPCWLSDQFLSLGVGLVLAVDRKRTLILTVMVFGGEPMGGDQG